MDSKELIKSCTRLLNQQQQTEAGGNMAQSPVIILFLGNVAYSHIQHVKNTLDANLKNGSYIQYLYLYFENDKCKVQNIVGKTQYENAEDAICEAWLTMFGTDASVFCSKYELYFECLLCSSEAQAEKYYEEYRKLNGPHQYNLIKTLYLMIDQQSETREERVQRLIDRIKECRQPGDSACVYLLSNLLYDGSILREDRIWQNYRLVANLILLGNTVGSFADAQSGNKHNYSGIVHDGALTAAYTFVGKPLEEITKISLYHLMRKLYDREEQTACVLETQEQLKEHLYEKLGVGDAGIGLISEMFQNRIHGKLPEEEACQWLPWRNKKEYRHFCKGNRIDWQKVNEMTCGVLSGYYKMQYESVMSKEICNNAFIEECREKIKDFLMKKFPFFDLLRALKNGEWKQIIREAVGSVLLSRQTAGLSMLGWLAERQLQKVFQQWAGGMIESGLQELYDQASVLKEEYLDALEEVRKEKTSFDGKDEHMDRYYETEVEQFLRSQETILEYPLFRADRTLDEILNQIQEIFGRLIRQRSIYGEPFEKEERLRLESMSELERSRIIKNRLGADVSSQSRLRLNYDYREQKVGTFCLVNTQSVYIEELRADEKRGSFTIFDLNRRDCLEMVELYRLDELDRIVLKE